MSDCPFMNPGSASDPRVPIYCRLPRGRVRMPTRDEIERFCRPARWEDCSLYLAARRHVRTLTGLH